MLGAVHPRPEELLDGGAPDESPGLALARVISDAVFQGPARRLGEAHAGTGTGRTFAYDFRWRSPACGGRLGACHGLELPFVFGTLAAATLCRSAIEFGSVPNGGAPSRAAKRVDPREKTSDGKPAAPPRATSGAR